ncbi:hypothetical protein JCM3765_006635 [Sporobolomyces pararoseus]
MSGLLPPPPPRHPSSTSRPSTPLQNSPSSSSYFPSPSSNPRDGPLQSPVNQVLPKRAAPAPSASNSPSHSFSRSTASFNDDDGSSSSPLCPPPKHPELDPKSETTRKLAEIEDLEIAEMLDRVGGRLTELRVAGEDEERAIIEYPVSEDFKTEAGTTDWTSFAMAYISTLIVAQTPPALVGHPPRDDFSLRCLRDDLSRLYVLCPPTIWQGFLLRDVARLYRWQDPVKTGRAAAIYTFLWLFNLLPLFPIGLLIYQLLLPRLSPPTPEEILAASNERRSRTKEAAELSKQLKNSSAGRGLGFAAEGIRGLFGEIKERLPTGRSEVDEKNLANALASNALLGGIAAGGDDYTENLRRRFRNKGGSDSIVDPQTTSSSDKVDDREDSPDEDFQASPATDNAGEVSLYRLVRNLARSFGPPIQTVLNETIDLLEMLRNVIQHPEHPASIPVLLRLVAVFCIVLITPTWLRLKSFFGYLGLEFFVLWKVREIFPQYRRATMIQWWIMAGAPTDADYALYVLRKRGTEGRAIRGSKTIRRMARKSRASSNASLAPDKLKTVQRLAQTVSDTASIRSFDSSNASTAIDKTTNTYFAFHRSVPGQIVLTSSSIRFVPAKRLRKLGFNKLVARAAKKWDPSIELDESYYHDGDRDSIISVDTSTDSVEPSRREENEVEMVLRVAEIEKVKKEKQYRLPALVISSKNGENWKFTNVSRRDDAFNKLLSFSANTWTKA